MSATTTPVLSGLRSAVERLKRDHPNTRETQGAEQALPTHEMMLALLRTMYALPEQAVILWAIELKPDQVQTLLLALEHCEASHISRACEVLRHRWLPRYWRVARHLLCEQVDQPKLRESLATLLIPWLKTEPSGVQHKFWTRFITAADPVAMTWDAFAGYTLPLDEFCDHVKISHTSPVEQQLSTKLLLEGNATQLLREPVSRLRHIGTLPGPQRLLAFVNYFQQLAPEQWQPEFMRDVADPRLTNNPRMIEELCAKLQSDPARALSSRYIDRILEDFFSVDNDTSNERFNFWRIFSPDMIQFPRKRVLGNRVDYVLLVFFPQFEVVVFPNRGDATYMYPRGEIQRRLDLHPVPTKDDLKKKNRDFLPRYIMPNSENSSGWHDNRIVQQGDWAARWRRVIWELIKSGWVPPPMPTHNIDPDES